MRTNIIKKIRLERAAKNVGCCLDYRCRILRAGSQESLIDIYLDGIYFCIANDYPSVDMIERCFDKAVYNGKGIYINERLDGKEGQHKAIIALGSCTGDIHYGDYRVSRIVARHDTKLDIKADGYAVVMVDIVDRAEVSIHASGNARVIVNHYGDAPEPEIQTEGDSVRIKVNRRDTKRKEATE